MTVQSIKLKVLPRFPVDVLGSSPILIDRTGGAYRFSLDIDALSVSVLSAKPITGTSNEISVAHGDGSGGNPTISLPNALTFTGKTVTGGTVNDILSMTAHTAGASPTAIAGTATLAKFYAGSSGTPVTTETPTVSISRYDNSYITGSNYPSALLVETVGNNTVAGFGLPPQNAASFRATQNGAGDVLGVGVEVFGNSGGGYYAYGYYFAVHTATVGRAAYGIEGAVWNNAISTPYAKGATSVYFAAANFLAAGNYDTTAGIYFSRGGFSRKFDAGLVGGIDSIASALVWDDSSAVTSYKDTGTHTDGIDLTQATYSGSAIKSTGFSVSPTGVLAAATGSTVNGIAIVNLSATQTLTNKSISGSSNTLTNIPISSAISGLGTGVATALGVNIGSAGAFVTFNGALGTPSSATLTSATGLPVSTGISGLGTGIATALAVNVGTAGAPVINGGALGSPSSVGTLPAHTLGGTISGGGNQINNVVIGSSTPLAGSFTTLSASTSLTSPLHIGGSGTTGTQLTLQTTTGNGTTDALVVKRGNNGGTIALTVNSNGLSIGATPLGVTAQQGDLTVSRSANTGAIFFGYNGSQYIYYDGSKYLFAGGAIALASATYLMRNTVNWTNNAAAATGTLTNAPAAGNPTKWIAIDDNGTTRYVPTW